MLGKAGPSRLPQIETGAEIQLVERRGPLGMGGCIAVLTKDGLAGGKGSFGARLRCAAAWAYALR